ncbi:MAG: hypothetical protein HS111_13360 [Kofleriaceae bacterium]|nr:hypothetical protein [Kofleriaceae bacterium]
MGERDEKNARGFGCLVEVDGHARTALPPSTAHASSSVGNSGQAEADVVLEVGGER